MDREKRPRKRFKGCLPTWVIAMLIAAAALCGAITVLNHLSNRTPTKGVRLSAHAISSENANQVTQLARLGKGPISDVAYSPDGDLLAVATSIGVFIHDAHSFKEVNFFKSDERVRGIAFSPDGSCLAMTTPDDVHLFQVSDGSPVCSMREPDWHEKGSSRIGITAVVFNPSGSYLAASTDYEVLIWDVPSGTLVRTLASSRGQAIAFSPDGVYLADGSITDNSIYLWPVFGGECWRTLRPDSPVTDIGFSPDGLYLAAISNQGTYSEPDAAVHIWRVSDGELIRAQKLDIYVNSIAFSPDGHYYAIGTEKGVRLFQLSDGRLAGALGGDTVSCLSFSPDGFHLACCSGVAAQIWRIADNLNVCTLEGFTAPVGGITFFPDDGCLASTGEEINLWRLSDGTLMRSLKAEGGRHVTFSPKGDLLAFASDDNTVQLRRFPDGALMHTMEGHSSCLTGIAISPDGTYLASGSHDKTVRLWRVADGEPLLVLGGHSGGADSIAFSPDGAYLAAGSRIWNISDGVLLYTLERTGGGDVVFSTDGTCLASCSRIWNAADGSLLYELVGITDSGNVNFSPDGLFIASAACDEHTVRLRRVADGILAHTLEGPRGVIWTQVCTAFSPDGALIAAGFSDPHSLHTILLWRVADGALLCTLEGHTGPINDLAFSPDGAYLVSCSDDGTVRLWGTEP